VCANWHLTIVLFLRTDQILRSASTEASSREFTQRSFGRARSNFTAAGNCTSDLFAVVLGFADVVGDVVGQNHLVSMNNLDGFVVGDVLDT
jgi:hypothetical protein